MRLGLILLCILLGCSAYERSRLTTSRGEQVNGRETYGEFLSDGLERADVSSERVKQAMSRVPRHLFVPRNVREQAYEDRALPIGHKQTISQPYIVALMTQASGADTGSRVLEIGTGSGFQAAVLAELGATVYSIEYVPELAERARSTLDSLGYSGIEVRSGDGSRGWREFAPYDAILVTAASPDVPPELLGQLANRGKLVIPLERSGEDGEELLVIERDGEDLITRRLGSVRFVPLEGEIRSRPAQRSGPSSETELNTLQEALQGREPQRQSVPPDESRMQTPLSEQSKLDEDS